jgi:CheY-like chemotaxis protein
MPPLLENATILVVDDDADTCEVLRSILEGSGASVITAQSVDAALAVFHRTPPHAVVTDIRLGVSDGYSLIKAIRELNLKYRGFTPAIAITGFASPEDEKKAVAASFDAYFSKPFDPADIVNTIAKVLGNAAGLAA